MPDVSPLLPQDSTSKSRGAWTVALGDSALPDTPQTADAPAAAPDASTLRASDVGTLDPLAAGEMLAGYKILSVLGRGGFGITYHAREVRSGREVAVKEFFPAGCVRCFEDATSSSSTCSIEPTPTLGQSAFDIARAQFLEAARALSRLRHPALARVWEFFESNGSAYLVMELLRGRTLQQCVHESGPLDEDGAITLAHALGEAVSTMHRLEFLHLDIKPENVMLCPSNAGASTWAELKGARVVLFDFDLLQRIEDSGLTTRPLTSHCGTPGYAPLEQYAQQATLGRFSDVYALGATLLHLLSAQDPPAAADRALAESRFSAQDWCPQLSEAAASAIEWAMEIAPRARPQSVEEWLPALREGRPQIAPPATPAAPTDNAATMADAPLVPLTWTGILAGASISGAQALPSAPVTPTLPSLPMVDNWYQFAARGLDFDWPYTCACCGSRPETSLQIRAGRARWNIPYCARCARHVKAGHLASAGTAWGITVGLAVAFVGWAMSDFWIGPIGVAIHFSSLAYGALKVQAAEGMMRSGCCERKHSVGYGGERDTRSGRKYLVRFRSLAYAHEWKAKNASKL